MLAGKSSKHDHDLDAKLFQSGNQRTFRLEQLAALRIRLVANHTANDVYYRLSFPDYFCDIQLASALAARHFLYTTELAGQGSLPCVPQRTTFAASWHTRDYACRFRTYCHP
jgi:hypothetical protein